MKLRFHWTKTLQGECYYLRLSLKFEQKVRITRDKYIKADYPFCFINSTTDGFNQEKEDLLIPTNLFEDKKS